ncbi:MAG: hypothetical protein JJT75_15075 [Opitutales bacterium]|nr:hypothetical protein [Opitutales bacterium]
MTDQEKAELSQDIMQFLASLGRTGTTESILIRHLRRNHWASLGEQQIRDHLDYLVRRGFIETKAGVLNPTSQRYHITPRGIEVLQEEGLA